MGTWEGYGREVVGGRMDPVSGSPAWPSPEPEIIIGTTRITVTTSNCARRTVLTGRNQVGKNLDSRVRRSLVASPVTYCLGDLDHMIFSLICILGGFIHSFHKYIYRECTVQLVGFSSPNRVMNLGPWQWYGVLTIRPPRNSPIQQIFIEYLLCVRYCSWGW